MPVTRCHSSYCPNPWQTLPCHQNIQKTGVLITHNETLLHLFALDIYIYIYINMCIYIYYIMCIYICYIYIYYICNSNAQFDSRSISKQQSFCTEALPAPQYHKESSLPAYEARKSRAAWHAARCKQRKCRNLVCKVCNWDQSLESFTNGPWRTWRWYWMHALHISTFWIGLCLQSHNLWNTYPTQVFSMVGVKGDSGPQPSDYATLIVLKESNVRLGLWILNNSQLRK